MEPPTCPRREQAVNYLLLNDGYEGDEPMENIFPATAQSSIESSIGLGPEDSIRQISLTDPVHDLEISPSLTASNISQRTRGTSNDWLWQQFEVTTLTNSGSQSDVQYALDKGKYTCSRKCKIPIWAIAGPKRKAQNLANKLRINIGRHRYGLCCRNQRDETTNFTELANLQGSPHQLIRTSNAAFGGWH
ncbi:hypothetical protein V1521DRAFT_464211 [Lipomyces starkeyi]